MTDKQIIFKCGVDCIRKNTEECFELDCIKGQESILKQLQAKEQECERLKEEVSLLKEINSKSQQIEDANSLEKYYLQQLDQLKADNDSLKSELMQTYCYLDADRETIDQLKADNDLLRKTHKTEQDRRRAYENALAEIKEMCNSVENIENVKTLYDAKLSGMYLQANQILQKISGCEGGVMFDYRKLHWKENQSHLKNWKTEIEYVTDKFSMEQLNKVISPFLRKGVKYEVGTFYDNGTVFVTIKYKVIDNLNFWLKELFKRGGND